MNNFDNGKISLRQLQALLALDLLGTSVITLPRRTAHAAGTDGWIAVLLGGLLLLGLLWMYTALMGRFKNQTIVEIAQSYLGRIPGSVICAGLAVKLLITSGLELRIFCEMINQTMLFRTPIWATAFAMAFVCVCVAAGGYECRGRAAEILFVLVIMPLLLLLIIAAFSVDYQSVRPVFQADWASLGRGSIITLFSFQGIEALLLVYPYLESTKRVKKRLFSAGALLIIITTSITLLTIAWFGEITVKGKLFPVLQMLDSIDIPGAFWNRQDIFMLWFWTVSVFASVGAGMFFSVVIAARLTQMPKGAKGKWLLTALLVVYFTAVLPGSAASATAYMDAVRILGGGFYMILLPGLLLILCSAKGGGKSES